MEKESLKTHSLIPLQINDPMDADTLLQVSVSETGSQTASKEDDPDIPKPTLAESKGTSTRSAEEAEPKSNEAKTNAWAPIELERVMSRSNVRTKGPKRAGLIRLNSKKIKEAASKNEAALEKAEPKEATPYKSNGTNEAQKRNVGQISSAEKDEAEKARKSAIKPALRHAEEQTRKARERIDAAEKARTELKAKLQIALEVQKEIEKVSC
jgi:hypothetical protein